MAKEYEEVEVHKDGKTYMRKQPLHHKINEEIAKHEIKRLEEEKEALDHKIKRVEEERKEHAAYA